MVRLVITRISGAFIPQEFVPFHDPMVNCADALQEPVTFRGRYSREPAFPGDLLFGSPRYKSGLQHRRHCRLPSSISRPQSHEIRQDRALESPRHESAILVRSCLTPEQKFTACH
jgi:hypothetical protein